MAIKKVDRALRANRTSIEVAFALCVIEDLTFDVSLSQSDTHDYLITEHVLHINLRVLTTHVHALIVDGKLALKQ